MGQDISLKSVCHSIRSMFRVLGIYNFVKRVFDLTVQTDAVALYVWLEAGGMYYSKVIIIY